LCRADGEFLRALAKLYDEFDERLSQHKVVCLGGGGCCKFDLTEHRLFVSSGELALLLETPPVDITRSLRKRCPWQQGPRCKARRYRPLGCRAHFCKSETRSLQANPYEAFHTRIRRLHESHCLPYLYAELTDNILQLSNNT